MVKMAVRNRRIIAGVVAAGVAGLGLYLATRPKPPVKVVPGIPGGEIKIEVLWPYQGGQSGSQRIVPPDTPVPLRTSVRATAGVPAPDILLEAWDVTTPPGTKITGKTWAAVPLTTWYTLDFSVMLKAGDIKKCQGKARLSNVLGHVDLASAVLEFVSGIEPTVVIDVLSFSPALKNGYVPHGTVSVAARAKASGAPLPVLDITIYDVTVTPWKEIATTTRTVTDPLVWYATTGSFTVGLGETKRIMARARASNIIKTVHADTPVVAVTGGAIPAGEIAIAPV